MAILDRSGVWYPVDKSALTTYPCVCVRERCLCYWQRRHCVYLKRGYPWKSARRSQFIICFLLYRPLDGNLRPANIQQRLRNFFKRSEKWEGVVGKCIRYLVFSSTLPVANGAKPLTDTEFNESITTIELLTHYCAGDKIEKNEMGWSCGAYGWGEEGV